MSQSPDPLATAPVMLEYDRAWAALNLLIREGHSFSGRERNCCFLNLGGDSPRFANVSSASGLDFIDDGRGVALADWDGDGDLDLWLSNRTGPRARFVRNDTESGNRSIAFRLEGTTSNRDAIGARLELHLGTDGATKRTRSLRAGHGHLSQSSKWVHFGLGRETSVDHVVVHWPGGSAERFDGELAPGGRFLLVEGSGVAEPVAPRPAIAPFVPTVPEVPSTSDGGRIVVLEPTPLPKLEVVDLDGIDDGAAPRELFPLATARGKPTLVNLWATWCAPCVAEMAEWKSAREDFEAKGLEIVSVSVDEPTGDPAADRERIRRFIRKQAYPYTVALPGPQLVERLETVQRTFVGRQVDLPVPSSFLIDGMGRIAVIYRGTVSPRQLLADMELLEAPFERVVRGAVPFPGKWMAPPRTTGALKLAVKFLNRGDAGGSRDYVLRLLELRDRDPSRFAPAQIADLENYLGAVFFDLRQFDDALAHWRTALAGRPDDRNLHYDMARALAELGRFEEAAASLREVLRLNRKDPGNLVFLGKLLARTGDEDGAIEAFRESLALKENPVIRFELSEKLYHSGEVAAAAEQLEAILAARPDWPPACNNLAWIRATAHDAALRDSDEAVRLATIATDAAGGRIPTALGTLAAAQARAGRFDQAVDTVTEAIAIATNQGDEARAEELRGKRRLYESRQPFTEPAPEPANALQ